ncbi:MAG: hypothetical protein JNJ61_16995 [Anaerolineae bacterium]|nr:hypothetical protein [Anaerolineae bacterium]
MADQERTEFQDVLARALELSPIERMAIIEELAASFKEAWHRGDIDVSDDAPFSPEEIAELTRVEPLPPAEVVALGLLGTWSHKMIGDGAEWVNEQKRKRRERRKWSTP